MYYNVVYRWCKMQCYSKERREPGTLASCWFVAVVSDVMYTERDLSVVS